MLEKNNKKPFNLEERTFLFAKEIHSFVKNLPGSYANNEDIKQLICASGSVGANYIEANEALSNKDFLYRIRISRKESKESVFWLRLISESNNLQSSEKMLGLIQEGIELKKILSAIIEKSK
jgi:four helix bundle protein